MCLIPWCTRMQVHASRYYYRALQCGARFEKSTGFVEYGGETRATGLSNSADEGEGEGPGSRTLQWPHHGAKNLMKTVCAHHTCEKKF